MDLLIVDDDQLDREFISRTLRNTKFRVNTSQADNVNLALDLLEDKKYDAILLDYRMPGRDGIELVKELRSHSYSSGTAIVMMSNNDDDEIALECIKAGAHDFVSKADITYGRLQRTITQSIAKFRLEQQVWENFQQAKELSEHDSLTGLANRYLFDETLKYTISHGQSDDLDIALVVFDLDRFNMVNDTYGHEIGDWLLVGVADRIKSILRVNEMFARLGGDEFAILINSLEQQSVNQLTARIAEVLKPAFEFNELSLNITLSMGVAFYPQDGKNARELFRSADIAMYRAKKAGQGKVFFVNDEMHQEFANRIRVENRLREAIEANELVLHYQPIVCPDSRHLLSCEALIRWQDPNAGLIYPDQFIEIAEDTGLIHPLGRWIIREACAQLKRWEVGTGRDISIGLNISAKQLYDKDFVPFLHDTVEEFRLSPSQLEIEITETALLKNLPEVRARLHRLFDMGFSLALDDFGTGFSSIQHLNDFPITTVKIDRSLMPNRTSKERSIALVKGLIAMIDSMGLSIVAEGVETEDDSEFCLRHGIRRCQGYLYGRPMLPDQLFEQFLP